MTVGLLSMQRVNNYGSFWQAYCLKKIIEKNKCIVDFIDIIPGEELTRTIYSKSFAFSKIKRIPYYIFQYKKHKIFVRVQKSILKCSDNPNYRDDYDAIFIGSDEVFNFVQNSPWGFSPQLYGAINNSNVNSYAACFGYTTLENIESRGIRENISLALSNLKHISVRDQNSFNIIKNLTNNDSMIHLDPVIIGDLPLNKLPIIDSERYILIYSYDFRFSDKNIIKQIKNMAKKEACKIYSVGFYQNWCDKNIVTDPIKLLSFFKYAQYIITDTFHGTIFSIRCNKKFVTIIQDTNRQKLLDLLIRLKLENRIVSCQDNIADILHTNINYQNFETLRQKERIKTNDYIRLCLGITN